MDSQSDEKAGRGDSSCELSHRYREQSACRPVGEDIIDSGRLFGQRHEILIRHAGEVYRLRVTRNGKLILNK